MTSLAPTVLAALIAPISTASSPHSHYDVILITTSRAYGTRSPHSYYDVILIVTSFTTELATLTVTDLCASITDTLLRLIYIYRCFVFDAAV